MNEKTTNATLYPATGVCIASWFFGWLIPLSALLVLVIQGSNANSIITWVGFLGCYLISVILHEFGHYFAAKLLCLNPLLVSIGHGDLLLEKFALGTTWRVHALAFSGYVYPHPDSEKGYRPKMIAMIAAGPLVNALIAIFCLLVMHDSEFERFRYAGGLDLAAVILDFFLANCFLVLTSLITFYPSDQLEKDGQMIAALLWNWKKRSGVTNAAPASGSLTASESTQPSKPKFSLKTLVKQHRLAMVLSISRQAILHPGTDPAKRVEAISHFITAVLAYDARAYLPEAEVYSLQLLEVKPDDCGFLSMKGCIMVASGRLAEGISVLRPAYDNTLASTRAFCAGYLAIA